MSITKEAQSTPPSRPDQTAGAVRAPATVFHDAPEVEEIASQAIRDWHPHLRDARIRYLWRDGGAWTSGSKTVLAKASKLGSQAQFLSEDFDAVILVDTNRWAELSEEQRVALVDHELAHLRQSTGGKYDLPLVQPNGRPVLHVVRHDVEEFVDVIRRHGLWDIDLTHAAKVIRQVPIPLPLAPVDPPKAEGAAPAAVSARPRGRRRE